ncbi:PUR family DNA/RNA-binding protein [Flavobacteriaceae bacterium 14752]|uniref:PUR family DNA/RNA-binding protein n=1 Tax=Mesohalobacter salilacus TaxID=2491711 RepID=UPI000F62EEA2|nr:DUF3276 family protein [Flavobacteriaceae bacterium 14752]
MSDKDDRKNEDIFERVIRAGRRTYFFDVRETKAGDYYLTITESKKFTNDDGSYFYRKHKIYLYKEDFEDFQTALQEATDFIINEKGEEVISERHQPNFDPTSQKSESNGAEGSKPEAEKYTDVDFEDI